MNRTSVLAFIAVFAFAGTAFGTLSVTKSPSSSVDIGRYAPFELTLSHDATYTNPFWDVEIDVTFTSPGGATYDVEGFYYENNTSPTADKWMVRFAPLVEGTWTYSLTMTAGGDNYTTTGSFECIASSYNGPLRRHPDNVERFVRDDGTPFNAIGTNIWTFDDPFLNGSWISGATAEGRWNTYFDAYADAKCNVYRRLLGTDYPPDNPHQGHIGIWQGETSAWPNEVDAYHLDRALAMDVEFLAAKEHNMALMVPLLDGCQPNFSGSPLNSAYGGPLSDDDHLYDINPSYDDAVPHFEKYFRYIVNRYSAFVDVWELFNEYWDDDPDPAHGNLSTEWMEHMADVIRAYHPYEAYVCDTSGITYMPVVPDAWQDLHSAHRYVDCEEGDVFNSDPYDATANARYVASKIADANATGQTGKPHVFSEFGCGNNMANDDTDLFRVAVWTAFHRDSGITLWDTQARQTIDEHPIPEDKMTGAYISNDTRDIFLLLQSYVNILPTSLKVNANQPTGFDGNKLNAYGVDDPSVGVYVAYIHNHDSHTVQLSDMDITIPGLPNLNLFGNDYEAIWGDPKTGQVVSYQTFDATASPTFSHTFTDIPDFTQDIAVLIQPNCAVQILTTSLPSPAHGQPYYYMLKAKGGGMPYDWSIVSGALPNGMILNTETGMISGTPLYGGSHEFTVQCTGTDSSTDQQVLSIQWTALFESTATEDGYILESSETSNAGGNAYTTGDLGVGDGPGSGTIDKQCKSILSFDTSNTIPAGAVIASAALKCKVHNLYGQGWTNLGTLYVDAQTGGFSGNTALETGDFQAGQTASQVATLPAVADEAVSSGTLNTAGKNAINRTGKTQFRLYFTTDDDDDNGALDGPGFYPGVDGSTTVDEPVLEVVYY